MTNRRQFLISSGVLGAWAIAGEVARRIAQLALEDGEPYLVPVEKPAVELWANASDCGYTFTLGCAEGDIREPKPTWREWLEGQSVDVSKPAEVRGFLEEWGWHRPEEGQVYVPPGLEEPLPERLRQHYLDWDWALHDCPHAQAYFFLRGVKLAERTATGEVGGSLEFIEGAHPGDNSRFVCGEGVEVLGALQQRLLVLGEKVQVHVG